MSPVQEAVLPLLPKLARPYNEDEQHGALRDLLVKAKTGTGKTLAYLVLAIGARIKAIEKAGVDALEKNGGQPDSRIVENARRTYARNTVGTVVISPTRELATQIPTKRPSSRTGIRDSRSSCSPAVRAKDSSFATSSVAVTTSSSLHPVGYVTFWRMTTPPKRLRLRHRCVLVISTVF